MHFTLSPTTNTFQIVCPNAIFTKRISDHCDCLVADILPPWIFGFVRAGSKDGDGLGDVVISIHGEEIGRSSGDGSFNITLPSRVNRYVIR